MGSTHLKKSGSKASEETAGTRCIFGEMHERLGEIDAHCNYRQIFWQVDPWHMKLKFACNSTGYGRAAEQYGVNELSGTVCHFQSNILMNLQP